MIDFIKPYPGEDELSYWKRKVYFLREVQYRIDYQNKEILKKLSNAMALTSQEKAEIDAFWDRYLSGSLKESFVDYRFYEFYKTVKKAGERLCDYIPDNFYEAFIDEYFTDPQHTRPFDDKNLYDVYFHDVHQPKTIFRKIRDSYLDANYRIITQEDAIEAALGAEEVILKVGKYSCAGKGVKFWNKSINDKHEIIDFCDDSANVTCQEVIKQHAELSRLNPSSINTVRVLTLFFDNQVHVLSSVLRMGVNGSRVDNASSGGIVCGIHENGQLKGEAFDTSGNRYLKHPQGTNFESVTIPNFSYFIDLSISLAERFSSMSRLISWDFAVGESGEPILIEFNISHGQLDFHQLCNGPIFGDLTEEVLKDVFINSFTLNSIIKSFKN